MSWSVIIIMLINIEKFHLHQCLSLGPKGVSLVLLH